MAKQNQTPPAGETPAAETVTKEAYEAALKKIEALENTVTIQANHILKKDEEKAELAIAYADLEALLEEATKSSSTVVVGNDPTLVEVAPGRYKRAKQAAFWITGQDRPVKLAALKEKPELYAGLFDDPELFEDVA